MYSATFGGGELSWKVKHLNLFPIEATQKGPDQHKPPRPK